jgi:predicted phage tail protein
VKAAQKLCANAQSFLDAAQKRALIATKPWKPVRATGFRVSDETENQEPGSRRTARKPMRKSTELCESSAARIVRLPRKKELLMTTEQKAKPVTDLFEQAMKSYEQALKTGIRMQEESANVFSNLISQATSPQDWQKQVKAVADDFVPQTQKAVDEGLKLIEQTSKASVDLLKKAVAAGQPTSATDAQAKMLGLWESSLNAMRDTAVSVTQANNKAIESWLAFASKGVGPVGAKTKA